MKLRSFVKTTYLNIIEKAVYSARVELYFPLYIKY